MTAGVLSNLRQVTEYAAKHESRFVKLLIQQNEIGGRRKTAAATKQLEQAQERISEVSRIIKRLYEDNVNGKISDERFMELSADYEQEQRELKERPRRRFAGGTGQVAGRHRQRGKVYGDCPKAPCL